MDTESSPQDTLLSLVGFAGMSKGNYCATGTYKMPFGPSNVSPNYRWENWGWQNKGQVSITMEMYDVSLDLQWAMIGK